MGYVYSYKSKRVLNNDLNEKSTSAFLCTYL